MLYHDIDSYIYFIFSNSQLPHRVSKTYEINFHFERRLTQDQRNSPAVYKGKVVLEPASNLVKTKQEDVAIRVYDKSKESTKNYGASSRDLQLLQTVTRKFCTICPQHRRRTVCVSYLIHYIPIIFTIITMSSFYL